MLSLFVFFHRIWRRQFLQRNYIFEAFISQTKHLTLKKSVVILTDYFYGETLKTEIRTLLFIGNFTISFNHRQPYSNKLLILPHMQRHFSSNLLDFLLRLAT